MEFMAFHGWSVPAADRTGGNASPANRRNQAAIGWGADTGVTNERGAVDLHALRALGLYGASEQR